MKIPTTLVALASAVLLSLAGPISAQWSSDPGANLVLSDRSGEQVQPKVAATSDGGASIMIRVIKDSRTAAIAASRNLKTS